jgi:hypothetical protein
MKTLFLWGFFPKTKFPVVFSFISLNVLFFFILSSNFLESLAIIQNIGRVGEAAPTYGSSSTGYETTPTISTTATSPYSTATYRNGDEVV